MDGEKKERGGGGWWGCGGKGEVGINKQETAYEMRTRRGVGGGRGGGGGRRRRRNNRAAPAA